jgi:hypothetical protein
MASSLAEGRTRSRVEERYGSCACADDDDEEEEDEEDEAVRAADALAPLNGSDMLWRLSSCSRERSQIGESGAPGPKFEVVSLGISKEALGGIGGGNAEPTTLPKSGR